ncbi:TM2 domain-containing protein 1 [Oryzias melastigma]|uniref:TM2 domain-containing protein 1 n=1 Tax=Oryzias melastigma TaxID=30732 RepID=A0A834BK38_ORYME|nr:TM2 domain-containing protein 1 isoform X1 [Oryzias melastigma]KAF6715177.1 TM2 domain-containing protein 1 [Oryzias melastigma]
MAFPLRKRLRCFLPFLCFLCVCSHLELVFSEDVERCEHLRLGQYLCKDPKIDDATQEPENCRNMQAQVECFPAPNISCRLQDGREVGFGGDFGFNRSIPCRNVSGYSYKVAVALSLFLGWLGADRFYLGYPALGSWTLHADSASVSPGLLKFCTVGFCGIGTLIDFILIAMQIVGPADGSSYIVDYYGARLTRLSITNETFRKPHQSL